MLSQVYCYPKNHDPAEHVGNIVNPLLGNTKCGIFIVRKTNATGVGHTSIIWDSDSLGYTGGDSYRSDQAEIRNINKKLYAISVYSVDFREKYETVYDSDSPEGRASSTTFGAGPKKGQYCTRNCADIIDCLKSRIGSVCYPYPHPPKGVADTPNCNTFAAKAIHDCCLKKDKLIFNGYTATNLKITHPDNEGNNIGWDWVLFD